MALSFGTVSAMMETHQLDGEQTDAEITIEVPSTDGVLRAVAAGADVTDWPEQPERIVNEAYSDTCDVTRRDTTSTLCEFGNLDSDRTVVMFGDSHAAMWIPALDRIGKQNDWKVIQLTKPGCVAPDLQIWSNSLGREYAECDEWRDWAIGQIAEIEPDVLLVTSAGKGIYLADGGKPTQDGLDDAWRAGLGSTLDAVTPHAGRVVVIGDMAYPAQPGIDCLTEHEGDASACNTPVEAGGAGRSQPGRAGDGRGARSGVRRHHPLVLHAGDLPGGDRGPDGAPGRDAHQRELRGLPVVGAGGGDGADDKLGSGGLRTNWRARLLERQSAGKPP